jgi:hypothetical protein
MSAHRCHLLIAALFKVAMVCVDTPARDVTMIVRETPEHSLH